MKPRFASQTGYKEHSDKIKYYVISVDGPKYVVTIDEIIKNKCGKGNKHYYFEESFYDQQKALEFLNKYY